MQIIKLDYDTEDINPCLLRINTVIEITGLNVNVGKSRVHKTNKGYHVRIPLKERIRDTELVLFQCLMGSDFKRECLNYNRVKRKENNWNILFNEKWSMITKEIKSIEKDDITNTLKLRKLLST